jgi:REP element-mobilizing transposase RayT
VKPWLTCGLALTAYFSRQTSEILRNIWGFVAGVIREIRAGMPRPLRIQDPGFLRHIVSRGTGRMKIFLDEGDYRMFTFLLGEVVQEYDLECFDFCFIENHFHLSVRNRRRNLSAAMQKLKGEYGSYWNQRHGRVGHVFEGPFKDQLVQHDLYFRHLVRYIALNPVRARLVAHPGDWPWSSYRFTAGLAPCPDFLCSRLVLEQLAGADDTSARSAYVDLIAAPSTDLRAFELFRSRRRILGDAQFKARFRPDAPKRPIARVSAADSSQFIHLPA